MSLHPSKQKTYEDDEHSAEVDVETGGLDVAHDQHVDFGIGAEAVKVARSGCWSPRRPRNGDGGYADVLQGLCDVEVSSKGEDREGDLR